MIQNGDLEKVRCPTKDCKSTVTEKDLHQIEVDADLVRKMTEFSISQAIDGMEDFGWCP